MKNVRSFSSISNTVKQVQLLMIMTDEKCQEFFQHFKHSQIYSIGCGNADPDWLFAWDFEYPGRHAKPEEIEPLSPATAAA